MRRRLLNLLAAILVCCLVNAQERTEPTTFTYNGNPLVRDKFTADPAPLVHNAVFTIDGRKGAIGRRSVCVDELRYNADGTMKYVEQSRTSALSE